MEDKKNMEYIFIAGEKSVTTMPRSFKRVAGFMLYHHAASSISRRDADIKS